MTPLVPISSFRRSGVIQVADKPACRTIDRCQFARYGSLNECRFADALIEFLKNPLFWAYYRYCGPFEALGSAPAAKRPESRRYTSNVAKRVAYRRDIITAGSPRYPLTCGSLKRRRGYGDMPVR